MDNTFRLTLRHYLDGFIPAYLAWDHACDERDKRWSKLATQVGLYRSIHYDGIALTAEGATPVAFLPSYQHRPWDFTAAERTPFRCPLDLTAKEIPPGTEQCERCYAVETNLHAMVDREVGLKPIFHHGQELLTLLTRMGRGSPTYDTQAMPIFPARRGAYVFVRGGPRADHDRLYHVLKTAGTSKFWVGPDPTYKLSAKAVATPSGTTEGDARVENDTNLVVAYGE